MEWLVPFSKETKEMQKNFRRWLRAIPMFVCLMMVALTATLSAQQSATVEGTVLDPAGQAVRGASVTVKSTAYEAYRRARTDAQGQFVIRDLAPGRYTVEISQTGFATDARLVTLAAGAEQKISASLVVASVAEEVVVESEDNSSLAVQTAPVKALLDAESARTEITSQYIRQFTSPVTDFADITQAAPGTVSYSVNGIGDGQAKTWFRGFADGNYTMTWDGVPFQDSNDPTHHSWAYVPAPAISYVDFDRSPGTASDVGPANFGGSIHMFSPVLTNALSFKGSESYGSFNTQQYLGEFNSGLIADKHRFWFEGHHMTSDGYQTNNNQVRTAGTFKYNYKIDDKTNFTLIGTSVIVDSNTPNNDATRQQLADHGKNYLMDANQYNPDGSLNANWYRYYTYHVPTNFEIATYTRDLAHNWKMDSKTYTYSYSNHQHYQNDQTSDLLAPTPYEAAVSATSGIDKLNQYNRIGEITSFSHASRNGVLRAGSWYEFTTTNRYQIKSNPSTWVDATGLKNIKFHEHFITQSVQPYFEYQYVGLPKWTITAGIKSAYYNMHLKQYADGKTVGSLNGAPYVEHTAGYNSWLPSLSANYRIHPNWSAFAQYGRGSVIPPSSVFDVTGAQVATLPKPTVADTVQGGSVLKLNKLAVDGDVYYIHFQNNYSSYTPTSGSNAGFSYYYANPASNSVGFEVEGNYVIAHGLSFAFNGTAGQAKYESTDGSAATATAAAVAAAPSAWVANTPNNTMSLGLTYQSKGWDAGFFNKRVGQRWGDDGNYHQNVQLDPFTVSNLFVNYTVRKNSIFDQSKIKLSVNNIFDNKNAVSISPANSVTGNGVAYTPNGADTMQLLPGRSVMITFQMGFAPREK